MRQKRSWELGAGIVPAGKTPFNLEMAHGFARPDHSPFAAFGVGLAYGERPDGSIVGIAEVRQGRACDCVCPACGEPLVAKKGPRIADHFAHLATGAGGCGIGLETNAHLWAKAVLEELKQIHLPAIEARIGERTHRSHRGRLYGFKTARLEKRLGEIVPDVVLVAPDGRELIVEVFVTHRCDEAKIAKIKDGAVSAIEVDLSAYRASGSEAAVRNALLRTAPRTWLFNPAVDEARSALLASLEEEKRVRAEAARTAARQTVARIRKAERIRPEPLLRIREGVEALGLGGLLGRAASTDGFIVEASLWQAAVIDRLVMRRSPTRHGCLWPVEIDEVMALIGDCLAPAARPGSRTPSAAALKSATPGYTPPEETVEAFLESLRDHQLLIETPAGLLISDRARAGLLDREAGLRSMADRGREADRMLGELFRAAEAEPESEAFSLSVWRMNVPGFDEPMKALVERGGGDWLKWREKVSAVAVMLAGGKVCETLVGLPFDRQLEDARRQAAVIAAEEAEAAEAAARAAEAQRCDRLRAAARAVLGADAEAWLERPAKNAPLTPLDAARRGEPLLGQAYLALDRLAQALAREAERETAVEGCRAQLRTAAAKVYEAERLELFLRTHRRELAMQSPLAYCRDEASLRICLKLLAPARARR